MKLRILALTLVCAIPAFIAWRSGARPGVVALALALPGVVLVVSLAFSDQEHAFRRVGVTIAALAISCFVAIMAEEFFLGGTPINGLVDGDRYYVGSHGRYREVSPFVFRAAIVFDIGVVALWPGMMVFAILNDKRHR